MAIFEEIGRRPESRILNLDIDYEILDSTQRIGGRVYTHRFDEKRWNASKPGQPDYYDYYDVGAMRFPGLAWMDRIIGKANNSLIPYINSKLKPEEQPIKLIPYIFTANNTFRLFNSKLVYGQVIPSAKTFKHDKLSVREYLVTKGFSAEQINWLETITDATSHFDTMSLTQAVIELWIFNKAPIDSWLCVEGGMDRVTYGMASIIKKPVEVGKRATAIKPAPNGGLKVAIEGCKDKVYDHVINTVPLGAMQAMDMTELDLDYRKKAAIRELQYDPAGKIGMKFKSRWWEELDSGSFQGGQSYSDLPIRRCVYPSYGVDTHGAAGTMIASYTWGQDSARLSSYYGKVEGRKRIVEMTLRNLAVMHNVTYEFLKSQYVDSHIWNWYDGEDAVGAFALFGPDEFSTVMPALLMPAANGALHFAGEALSAGHAWMIGATDSAYRTVAEILAAEGMDDKLVQLVNLWGTVDEVDMSWYSNAFAGE
ncbi:flavin containing amine oxidoreductase [Hirsutella rhossiliensis]|uniref:Flavin containing amine oxidoreductase domain-containing protein n=1 Tax=Hirsutella rhossiliensis TaxID=111463 RepID=A0A9P8MTY7_9HYPO|nr:flavin containing amine oxidoreductase domain-containing protein [Hirsutella rhossiliensis]KAH0961185.1 flavin containing amine oxidoreductase domain-containing protein [Hirsutella rhossiliensis]